MASIGAKIFWIVRTERQECQTFFEGTALWNACTESLFMANFVIPMELALFLLKQTSERGPVNDHFPQTRMVKIPFENFRLFHFDNAENCISFEHYKNTKKNQKKHACNEKGYLVFIPCDGKRC